MAPGKKETGCCPVSKHKQDKDKPTPAQVSFLPRVHYPFSNRKRTQTRPFQWLYSYRREGSQNHTDTLPSRQQKLDRPPWSLSSPETNAIRLSGHKDNPIWVSVDLCRPTQCYCSLPHLFIPSTKPLRGVPTTVSKSILLTFRHIDQYNSWPSAHP